jgi:hypothetical protein
MATAALLRDWPWQAASPTGRTASTRTDGRRRYSHGPLAVEERDIAARCTSAVEVEVPQRPTRGEYARLAGKLGEACRPSVRVTLPRLERHVRGGFDWSSKPANGVQAELIYATAPEPMKRGHQRGLS